MPSPLLTDIPTSLATGRLDMRPPHSGDGPLLHAAIVESLTELRHFLAALPWVAEEQSVESAEIHCRNAQSKFIARTEMPFFLFDRQSGQLVGCVGLYRPDWSVPKFEVGYWCRTSHTGQGFVTEAVRAVTALAFEALGAVRVELITDEENTPSRHVAEQTGFMLEGTRVNDRRAPDGTLRSTCMYARLVAARTVIPQTCT